MKLAVKASQAAHEDLSDFFELWGFFIPGKGVIEQYGTYDYLVTEEMIRKAKAGDVYLSQTETRVSIY